ncbi:MAG: hypothetical protein ACO22U_17510, partial [bacterium]
WNATTGADNYTVYFSTDNSSFTAISPAVTGTSYTHTGLSASTTYYYYIKANNTAGASGESNRASDDTLPPQPLSTPNGMTFTFSAGDTDDNVTVSWNAVSNADLYELWYTSDNTTTPSSGGTQIDNINGTSVNIPSGISGNSKAYYFELRAKDSTGNHTPSNYRSADTYTPCRRVEVSGTGIEGAYSSSETSVTALAMTRAPQSVGYWSGLTFDTNYVPGCSTVRLNDHVLQPKYRVTTNMPGWNNTSGYGFPPGSQLIGLLKDSAAAPYDESDYAYAWLMKYDDLKMVSSVSIVVNGVIQETKEVANSSSSISYGFELSANGSELYFLMAGSRHSGLVSVHGSVGNGTENDQDTVHVAYQGAHRYFDGIPVVNPSSYAANALAFWELQTVNIGGTPASGGSFSDPLNSDAGLIYRATGLSLPTDRSIVITDRMNDQKGPSTPLGGPYMGTYPSLNMNFSTREARATDGFSKRTEAHDYPATSFRGYAEHLIKTEPAPLEHPTGLTITDSTPTSVTMSWTAGAVDNYTLLYDNVSGWRVNRENLGKSSTPPEHLHYGWFYRSGSTGTSITPTVWDWDSASFFAGTPKLPSCGSLPQKCFQRDFADFRREGISGTSATITGLTEGSSDFLLKSNHSKQLGFWP